MKAKILALIIGLGMGLVFCSCEKDLEKYSGTDYIRFVSVFEKDSVDYNFGLAGKTTTDRIGIEVKVTGEVLDYDREYKVKALEERVQRSMDEKNLYTEKEVHELLDEDFYMSDDEKLYYEEKQKFEEKTKGVINRYVAKINDEIHQEYIHAVRQEYSSR